MKHPYEVYPNDSFLSVVIPTFNRPFYLEKAIASLEKYADMPYELIVHDDGSSPENTRAVFEMSDKISTLIINNGLNSGLTESVNRIVSLASSKYILFLADDCFMCDVGMQDVCNVLAKPYVGIVCLFNQMEKLPDEEICEINGTRMALTSGLGGGATIAFRKEVFEEVGRFDYRSPSPQADNVFIFKILKAGYWKAKIEGPSRMELGNYFYDKDYIPTEPMMKSLDCGFSKIFGIPRQELVYLSHVRRECCTYWVDGERTIPNRETYDDRDNPVAGLNDINYWGEHFVKLFSGKNSDRVSDIDWSVAEVHGQSRWKESIINDFRL